MSNEDTILTQLMEIRGALGRVEGGQIEIKANQSEMRKEISNLYDLHRNCSGPHLSDDVAALRDEIRRKKSDDKISRPPSSGGVLLSWADLKVVLRSLPFVAVIGGGTFAMTQCGNSATAKKAEVIHVGTPDQKPANRKN